MSATRGVPSDQRLASTAPADDSSNAAAEAATPAGSTVPRAPPTSSSTPTIPAAAPPSTRPFGRSATISQAKPAMVSGASAMTDAATLDGSSCAAT